MPKRLEPPSLKSSPARAPQVAAAEVAVVVAAVAAPALDDGYLALAGPTTATPGSLIQFAIAYNTGVSADSGCEIGNLLPNDGTFGFASDRGTYNPATPTMALVSSN